MPAPGWRRRRGRAGGWPDLRGSGWPARPSRLARSATSGHPARGGGSPASGAGRPQAWARCGGRAAPWSRSLRRAWRRLRHRACSCAPPSTCPRPGASARISLGPAGHGRGAQGEEASPARLASQAPRPRPTGPGRGLRFPVAARQAPPASQLGEGVLDPHKGPDGTKPATPAGDALMSRARPRRAAGVPRPR